MHLKITSTIALISTLLLSVGALTASATCLDGVKEVRQLESIAHLDKHYAQVPSTVDCNTAKSKAEKLICANPALKKMELLDAKAYVYSVENATGAQVTHKTTQDTRWIKKTRDKCTNEECLCKALIAHTTDSMGESPYKNAGSTQSPVLSSYGYGAVTFGESLEMAEKKLGQKAIKNTTMDDVEVRGCSYVKFTAYPHADFMVEKGIVTRADVSEKATNALKLKVGTSLLNVINSDYEALTLKYHQYERGHYLIFKSPDERSAIVLEEVEGKVTQVRGGLEPAVEYVEGCL
jgi:uncharacterized protein